MAENSDNSTAGNSSDDNTTANNGSRPAAEKTTEYVDPSSLPNTLAAWWFMKNEEHLAPSAQEEINLSKYDAWYVRKDLKEDEKYIYLTFDCGYENGYTASMLDVLKAHEAPAAFFVCRHFIEDQPELIIRMKEEGHIVGNHTANHICMPESDERTIREEISENADYMKEATGYEMDAFFRPPKGEYSERTLQITKNMGYTTVFWSLAYLDYDVNDQPGADYVINQFDKYIHPGAIPLIHNISESNAQALDTVLTNLENEGYTFHSLTDLLTAENS
ncbi:MAG: polysaccharide deacetylase family protein [Clostridiales bacterium]|nr:polysaccharide deacetylase family protein [Clostridiales bacterium]